MDFDIWIFDFMDLENWIFDFMDLDKWIFDFMDLDKWIFDFMDLENWIFDFMDSVCIFRQPQYLPSRPTQVSVKSDHNTAVSLGDQ